MKRHPFRAAVWCFVVGTLAVAAYGQSLTDKLEEEQSFYTNYGKEPYAKLKIEKDVVGLYDEFGEHIVDGVHLYELSNSNQTLTNETVKDSVDYSKSLEYQKKDFYEKFSNLVVTQDAIGGVKTSFLVGDQITTKFTPLTFNKTNFKGIRWDWWSSGLKFTALLTRTRPGFTSKMEDGTGEALVEYPITDNSLPNSYYDRGIKGDQDFSNKSPYGDYDFLWALHAENTIANKVDLGLTLVNHHTNDIKKGPNIFSGDLPDSLLPEFIHFEFYDLTPADTLDAGVYVQDVRMYINGDAVEAAPAYRAVFRRAFVGDRDNVLLPRDLPLARPQNGAVPVIVEFGIYPKYWRFVDAGKRSFTSTRDIHHVKFEYKVAGNYQVFASTDRQIPLCISGVWNPQTRKVDYSYPRRSVGEIYDAGLAVDASGTDIANKEDYYSTTYFGEYIAQAQRKLSLSDAEFSTAVEQRNAIHVWPGGEEKYNARTHNWEFNLNVSSFTLGLNFRGELLGIKFAGEFAYNNAKDMLPGGGDESKESENKIAGMLKAERPIGKQFGLKGNVYYISPRWMTNLENLQSSQYFNQTAYKTSGQALMVSNGTITTVNVPGIPDYQVYPAPLDHRWQNVDDNDDKDAFVDWEPRRYPSDLDAKYERGKFLADGTFSPYYTEKVALPSGIFVPYDDPDGVVGSKNDKNLNGMPDYQEDFLLFSSDPPVFDLGVDLNNNGIPDYEDDDLLPDFFTEAGRSVGSVITGDGVTTLGIQGFDLNLRWSPMENTYVDAGVIIESVVDRDLDLSDDAPEEEMGDDQDGRSQVGYLTFKREVLKRSEGLQYEFGNELRYVRDAIRNDVIRSNAWREGEKIAVDYQYRIDPLNYRHAIVDNLVGTIAYTNIRNFEYGARAKIGGEYHLGLGEKVYSPNIYTDYTQGIMAGNEWKTDRTRAVADLHLVNRVQYRLRFTREFEGWKSFLNFLNRVEIVPQYKLAFSWRHSYVQADDGAWASEADPRNLRQDLPLDYDGDGTFDYTLDNVGANIDSVQAIRMRWYDYIDDNWSYLMSVPIIRADFKIAENTKLQVGYQWQKNYNLVSPESNLSKHTFLAQVVSKAQYKGYSVTFFLGGKYYAYNYDVNANDVVTFEGSLYNKRGYEFFAKLFSGI